MQATRIKGQNALILLYHWALRKFHLTVKTRLNRLLVIAGPNARNEIAFYVLHSFLVEVQTNASFIHATDV